jgi:plasmid maintenance system killer protein
MGLDKLLQPSGGKLIEKNTGFTANTDENGKKVPVKKGEPNYVGDKKEAFFPAAPVEPQRASRLYPYRLLVIDIKSKKIINNANKPGSQTQDFYVDYNKETGGVNFVQQSNYAQWEFILPITPQQLSITNQFAINTTATMRGIVEEHNGVKFKIIQASGTTGIWPTRQQFEDPQVGKGQSLFGGTVEALGSLRDAANALAGKKPKPKSLDVKDDVYTGYFQAMLLQQFLEQYAIAKKNPVNKNWRLVFDCPKNNESFIVTPMQYTVTKSQRSPGEHLYNMQFKAWKRVDLKETSTKTKEVQSIDPNFFQKLNNSLDNARSLMSASLNVIKAVRADFRKPFDTLRKVTLLAKDFAGIAVTLADLPNQINKDIASATKKRVSDLDLALSLGLENRGRSAQSKINSAIEDIKKVNTNNEQQPPDGVESSENGPEAAYQASISPVNNIFNEPEGNFDFFNSITLDEIDLTPQQSSKAEDEINDNSEISITEIKDFIKETQDLILDLSNNAGAGDPFFSQVYGRPDPKERATPMTLEEFELIRSLEEAVLNMNILVSNRNFDDVRTESPLEYVGGLAEDSGVPFESSSTSKYLAPVPFGLTIEEISARYLGDADRYNEIITLNNLRSPYIDEDGFFYRLLSNADGRQFNIESDENLFVDQKIQISSNTKQMFTRKITAIEKITDSNYLITVDGEELLNLTTDDDARIKAFLPGTVNSQNQIYIPSDQPLDEEPRTFDIPFLNNDDLTGISKIDWLIDDKGDLVINSFGEVSLANGLNNLIQALKMKVQTQKGSLLGEENFGLGIQPGVNVTDINIENVLADLRDMVLQDSRFEAVDKIEINLLPPDLSITIQARLANGRGIFPISFNV